MAIGFTTLLAFGLITFVGEVPALGGTTALLLLGVFTVVNIAVLVLRQRSRGRTSTSGRRRFLPILGALTCALPRRAHGPAALRFSTDRRHPYRIGVVLWVVTVLVNRATGQTPAEPSVETLGTGGPVN